MKVTLGQRPANIGKASGETQAPSGSVLGGVSVQNLTPALRNQLGVPDNVAGVVVSDVDQNSPAAQSLQQGDVIESINRQPVHNVADFNRLAGEAKGRVLLRINRQGMGLYIVISSDGGQ